MIRCEENFFQIRIFRWVLKCCVFCRPIRNIPQSLKHDFSRSPFNVDHGTRKTSEGTVSHGFAPKATIFKRIEQSKRMRSSTRKGINDSRKTNLGKKKNELVSQISAVHYFRKLLILDKETAHCYWLSPTEITSNFWLMLWLTRISATVWIVPHLLA